MAITETDLSFLIQQRLAEDSAIAAIVKDRIRPDHLDTNEKLPAIRYELLNSIHWPLLNTPPTEGQSRLQIDAYADLRIQANNLAEKIRSNLHGFSGDLGSIRVHDCFMTNRYDRRDPPPPGGKKWRNIRVMDFLISHTEPVPTL